MSKNRCSFFNRFLLVRLALIAVIAVGAFLAYLQTTAAIRARQSESWPKTFGVLSVKAGEYRKTLSYQYSVNGVNYTADRVIFGELGNRTLSKEWTAVSESPNGSVISVYYNPDHPKESTLHTGLVEGSWSNFLFGAIFFLGGITVLILFPRLKRIQNKAAHTMARDGQN